MNSYDRLNKLERMYDSVGDLFNSLPEGSQARESVRTRLAKIEDEMFEQRALIAEQKLNNQQLAARNTA